MSPGTTRWAPQLRTAAGSSRWRGVLDYEDVKRARYQLPTVRDSNLDLIQREVNRLSWSVGIPPESRKV